MKLGGPQEALAAVNVILDGGWGWEVDALAAAVHYALAQYEPAAQLAGKATAQMDEDDLSNPRYGAVRLTLAAAEARLGLLPRAKAVLADFNAAVPSAQTVSAIKKWMSPAADLAGYEHLYDGLRLAGVAD